MSGKVTSVFERLTVSKHVASSKLKPVKLLELGEDEHGKFAHVEFEDATSRPLYLDSLQDAWSSFFVVIGYETAWKVRGFFRDAEPEALPDGNIKRRDYLSFHSKTQSKRGKYISDCHFDVEPKPYFEGAAAGLEVAREFLHVVRAGAGIPHVSLAHMIKDLARAMDGWPRGGFDTPDHSHVAAAFLSVLDGCIRFSADKFDIDAYINMRLMENESDAASYYKGEEMRKSEKSGRVRNGRGKKQHDGGSVVSV